MPTIMKELKAKRTIHRATQKIAEALKSLKIAWTLEPDNEKVGTMIRNLGEVPGPTMLGSIEMGG